MNHTTKHSHHTTPSPTLDNELYKKLSAPRTTLMFKTRPLPGNITPWNAYLRGIPSAIRSQYDCSTCRKFFDNYGGLCTIEDGQLWSVWHIAVGSFYDDAINGVIAAAEASIVTAPLLSFRPHLGNGERGGFTHFTMNLSDQYEQHKLQKLNPGKSLASITQLYVTATNTLLVYLASTELAILKRSLNILKVNAKGDNRVKYLQWLVDTSIAISDLSNTAKRTYVMGTLVKDVPERGRPSKSAAGVIISCLLKGKDDEHALHTYYKSVSSDKHMRSTNQLEGAQGRKKIEEGIAAIEALGLTDSFRRRVAGFSDLAPMVIIQDSPSPTPTNTMQTMLDKRTEPTTTLVNKVATNIPTTEFIADVLPKASKAYLKDLPVRGPYYLFTTSVVDGAPPIHKHDNTDPRYPVTAYTSMKGATRADVGMAEAPEVMAVIVRPEDSLSDHPQYMLIMQSTDPTLIGTSSIFPSTLIRELYDYRVFINQYSEETPLESVPDDAVCGITINTGTRTFQPICEIYVVVDQQEYYYRLIDA